MTARVVTHIRHVRHQENSIHAWCGLRVDIRPWVSDKDYLDREAKGLTAGVCGNCKAARAKGIRREASGL
jgi:hypothetical protein